MALIAFNLDYFEQTFKMDSEDDDNATSTDFNQIIGYIEDIVISANFQVKFEPLDLEWIVN